MQDGEGYYRRIRRVRSRQSLREKVWLPGKMESHNILVSKSFVTHSEKPAEKGRLQYYYPEPVPRECHSSGAAINVKDVKDTENKLVAE